MNTTISQSTEALAVVDKALADPALRNEPRALLLLRTCQVAQAFRPDILEQYWPKLRDLSGSLPAEHREAFEGLRAAVEPPPKASLSKFAQEIVAAVNDGGQRAADNPDEARRILRDCEARLRKRWWPFGKQPAWIALVHVWAAVDRAEALKLLGQVPPGVQQNIVGRLNDASPLTPDEWDLAHQHAGSSRVVPLISDILDRDKPALRLSARLAEAVSQSLLSEVHVTGVGEESTFEARREKALQRYLKLVRCVNEASPDLAESLMESLYTATITTGIYKDTWVKRFTLLRQLIGIWVEFPEHREKAVPFLSQKIPQYLRDFSLAQWFGSIPNSPQEVDSARQRLDQVSNDKASSEAWFVVTLVRRGLEEAAMAIAQSSPRSMDLVPRIRRAWLLVKPETASIAIAPQDVERDLISQFLLLGSVNDRVEFLRRRTENGKKPLPKEMWSQPNLLNIAKLLVPGISPQEGTSIDNALLSLFRKDEPLDRQFHEYLRMNGFGQYSYDELDPHLLITLLAWHQQAPAEVASVLSAMWSVMKPDMSLIRFDVLRNAIFERCQMVFAAEPTSLNNLFIKWVKRELVDKTVREQVGNTIYTFSLQDIVPFLYCLLSAQKVAKLSASHCDEILKIAIRDYTANDQLMTAAAQLYASDKGLSALQPPVTLKKSEHIKAWQLGVVQTSVQEIIARLLTDQVMAQASAT